MIALEVLGLLTAGSFVGFALRQYLGERHRSRDGYAKGMLTRRAWTAGYMEGADSSLKCFQHVADRLRDEYRLAPTTYDTLNDWITSQRANEERAGALFAEAGLIADEQMLRDVGIDPDRPE